ncbi:hypothetical protein HMPREF9140_01225 [Prevotella micans F0438]|uniref:HU domain-containing protein n=1 Tax=Prevotella micans F0438 TaxID=883158 RepID=H1Q2T7_9BACT|nr:hypothetical protein HMPREF9140_01225 [Prevotella micans F0438]
MISFKVVESILRVGPRKGQKGYGAVQKAPMKFSQEWLIDRIVRETSLSEGDVRNVFITLRNIVVEVVTMGGSLDLGDIFSLRTTNSLADAGEGGGRDGCLCAETPSHHRDVERCYP